MEREHSEQPSVSTPVTSERKGLKSSPTSVKHRGDLKDATLDRGILRATASSTKRPSVVTSRSLSSGSSISESNSILSSSNSESSSSMATDVTAGDSRTSEEDGDEDDEKSSGHTVVTKRVEVDTVFQLAEGQENSTSRHSDPTRTSSSTLVTEPSPTAAPSRPVYFSQLPVAQSHQQHQQHRQARARPTRHNTFTVIASSSSTSPSERNQTRSRAIQGGVPPSSASSNNRAHSTSPRNTLSRSMTTSAIPSMGAANHFMHSTASTSPPQQFPSTSSIAPPVHNTASVTFAPITRARAYSTSASGVTSPTSPAFESMAAINIEAMRKSPSSSTGSSTSPPPAPLASHHALFNATHSTPGGGSSSMHGKSMSAGYEAATTSLTNASNASANSTSSSSDNSSSNSSALPLSPPHHPSTTSSAANRRHTIDPYSQRNNNTTQVQDNKSLDNSTPLPNIPAGHRRHHQSISVPPSSSSEYSSLGDLQNRQASHTHQLNSRYRKSSLGSQALLSPTALDHMTSPSASILASVQSGSSSSSRAQQWDHHAHRGHHGVESANGGPQLSPTRSRNDPYLSSTSPRYSSRASHEAQRNNQLEAKIVLLGRQGVGKTSLVHRYITGKFSSTLPMTIGASFLVKKLDFEGGIKVRLQIWDTAGQERFRSMAPMYYRGAHAAILVYDLTNDESLADIQVWLDELRRNMSSDLIVHIVGNKADLAHTSRKITLEDAKRQIAEWIARPAPSDTSATTSSLNAPQTRRSTSGGHATSNGGSRSADEGSPVAPARSGMVSLGSFNLSRSNTRTKLPEEVEPSLPAFKDWGLEEVSAKEDDGIDMLFATIAGKLVERKHQIEQERVLRTKDSIMITDEMKGKADDPTRVWGCC